MKKIKRIHILLIVLLLIIAAIVIFLPKSTNNFSANNNNLEISNNMSYSNNTAMSTINDNTKNSTGINSPKNEISATNSSSTNNNNDEQISKKPEFTYKMAEIDSKTHVSYGQTYKTLYYVIEYNQSDYIGRLFSIYDKDGNNLSSVISSVNCELTTFAGNICELDEISHVNKFNLQNKNHKMQYVLKVVFKNCDYDFNDLIVKSTLEYSPTYESEENFTYSTNATLSDITTKHKIIHSSCLVNLDDSYYVFDNQYGSANISSLDNGELDVSAKSCNYWIILGKPLNELMGKKEVIDSNGNLAQAPNGCKMYFGSSSNTYFVGIQSIDNSELYNDQFDINSIHFKYTDTNEFSSIFITY